MYSTLQFAPRAVQRFLPMEFMNEERRELLIDEVTRSATFDFVYDFATYTCAAVAWFFYDPILTPISISASMLYGSRSSGRGLTWLLPALVLGQPRLALRCMRNAVVFILIGIVSGMLVSLVFHPRFTSNVAVAAFLVGNPGVFLLAFVAGFTETYAHVRRIKSSATHTELASALASATPLAASVMGGMIGAGEIDATVNASIVLLLNIIGIVAGCALWMVWQRLRWLI